MDSYKSGTNSLSMSECLRTMRSMSSNWFIFKIFWECIWPLPFPRTSNAVIGTYPWENPLVLIVCIHLQSSYNVIFSHLKPALVWLADWSQKPFSLSPFLADFSIAMNFKLNGFNMFKGFKGFHLLVKQELASRELMRCCKNSANECRLWEPRDSPTDMYMWQH